MGEVTDTVPLPRSAEVSTSARAGKGTFLSVQALRCVAAVMVVALHATMMMSGHVAGAPGAWLGGGAGVDLFFVISGFVMTISSQSLLRATHSMRTFMLRRLERVVPMYWLATTVKLFLMLLFQGTAAVAAEGAWHIVASYLFIPSLDPVHIFHPVLIVGWTLSYEMLFYLIFAIGLGLGVALIPYLSVTLFLLAIFGLVFGSHLPLIFCLANPILIEFLLGVFIARFCTQRNAERLWQKLLCVAAIILGFAIILNSPDENVLKTRLLVWGLAAFLIVGASVLLEQSIGRRIPRALLELGDASYSIYLTHTILLAVFGAVLVRYPVPQQADFRVLWVGSVVLCLLSGESVYRGIELPIVRFFKGRRVRATPALG